MISYALGGKLHGPTRFKSIKAKPRHRCTDVSGKWRDVLVSSVGYNRLRGITVGLAAGVPRLFPASFQMG